VTGVKLPRLESDHSFPCSDEVKNAWNCTALPVRIQSGPWSTSSLLSLNFYGIEILGVKSHHIKLLFSSSAYRECLPDFCRHQVVVSVEVRSSKNWTSGTLQYLFFNLVGREKYGCVSIHVKPSECIYECYNVGTLYCLTIKPRYFDMQSFIP
jgi:hypothetical protein